MLRLPERTMSDEIIPFGKYKGQPLEAIQSDKSYLDWLLAQSWFKEKHQDMYTIIINNFQEPADTPLHNAMQIKFLNADYVIDFLNKPDVSLGHYRVSELQFEVDGWDVMIRLSDRCGDKLARYEKLELQIETKQYEKNKLKEEADSNNPVYVSSSNSEDFDRYYKCINEHIAIYEPKITKLDDELNSLRRLADKFDFYNPAIWIEIKPTVSDDFPSVLRQIEAMSRTGRYSRVGGSKYLLVGEYTGIGATREEFIAFMKTKDITVIFA